MPFRYDGPAQGPLRQGEVIGPVWIHRADAPASALAENAATPLMSTEHELMIVIHADCDVEHDYGERDADTGKPRANAEEARLLPGIMLCDLFTDEEIRGRGPPGSEPFRRIKQNQNERFHRIAEGEIAQSGQSLPNLYLDFKHTYIEPAESLYSAISSGTIRRFAIVPPIYLHDLMHRFFGFQSRIALPE